MPASQCRLQTKKPVYIDHGPEVITQSTLPEVFHNPRTLPPEVTPGEGLEVVNQRRDYYEPTRENLSGNDQFHPIGQRPSLGIDSEDKDDYNERKAKRRRNLMVTIVVVAIVFAAAIGGGVGGALSHKSASSSDSASSLPAPVSPTTTGPAILKNTSIAATTCANGDRWVFLQDVNGNIRGATYSLSSSSWSVTDSQTIALKAAAKLGTPLSATCVNVPSSLADFSLNPGQLISIIYLNSTFGIQQVSYSNGGWGDTHIYSHSTPPAPNTKLSLSTNVISSLANTSASNANQNPYFSNIAAYQAANGSFIMVDLGIHQESLNKNLFWQFEGMSDPSANSLSTIGASVACLHEAQAPTLSSLLFTHCELGDFEQTWEYNQSTIDQSFVGKLSQGGNGANSYWNGTTNDVSLVLLAEGNLATVHWDKSYIDAVVEPVGIIAGTTNDFKWPTKVPYDHISATSLSGNSTVFYVYYQKNDTAMAEISFNVVNGFWSDKPAYIQIS